MENIHMGQLVDVLMSVTSQLVFMAVGVFAVVGSLIAARSKALQGTWLLLLALFLFAGSVVAAYFLQGRIIFELQTGSIDLHGAITWWGIIQVVLFVIASICFIGFVAKNLEWKE